MIQDFSYIIEKVGVLGHTLEVVSHIKSGKEASVFRVLLDGDMVAMKAYKDPGQRNFQNTNEYLVGKFYRSSSARRAIAKKNTFGKKLKHENWVKREFFMLQELHAAGGSIPRPILHIEDAIFMELLGDEEVTAPRLIDVELTPEEAVTAHQSIIENMILFWKHGIVHADLSPYNILWWKSKPFIIDFPQSIDARTHPDAQSILERDLKNISKYFSRYIDINFVTPEQIISPHT